MPGGAGRYRAAGRREGRGPPGRHARRAVLVESSEKPDLAAKKAYKAAMKALDKAKELEADAAATSNPDKKAKDMEKVGDAIQRGARCLHRGAKQQERHGGGLGSGRIRAFAAGRVPRSHRRLQPHARAQARAAWRRSSIARRRISPSTGWTMCRIAYMDLFNHAPELAAQLMAAMQKWLADASDRSRAACAPATSRRSANG